MKVKHLIGISVSEGWSPQWWSEGVGIGTAEGYIFIHKQEAKRILGIVSLHLLKPQSLPH